MKIIPFDINNRYASSSDFDPTQIKEFHIRTNADDLVPNINLVMDNFSLGKSDVPLTFVEEYDGTEVAAGATLGAGVTAMPGK